MPQPSDEALTQAFEAGQIDAGSFHHREHVIVAIGLLGKYDFIDASAIYARGIKALAAQNGIPEKFNLTITYAFMGLIAERLAEQGAQDADAFIAANPDLMGKDALAPWYSPARLGSDLARSCFLLPDCAA